MRAVILSDIHANFEALKTLEGVIDDADLRICLGDFIGYYCQVNEVLEFIRSRDFLCIRGNHDDFLNTGCPVTASDSVRFGIEYADRVIDPGHRRWLAELPLVWGGLLGGEDRCSTLLCHGSPWRPLEDYLYSDSPLLPQLERFAFDLIAFGQTHRPLSIEQEGRLRLNPGSVGQSRHRPGVACAAVVELSGPVRPHVSLIEMPFDPEPVVRLAMQAGAGDWIRKHLFT